MSRFCRLIGVGDTFDPSNRFETSWLLPPYVLGAWRALIALFGFTTLFFIFGWRGTHGISRDSRESFSFFTILTFWDISFYGLFGMSPDSQSTTPLRRRRHSAKHRRQSISQRNISTCRALLSLLLGSIYSIDLGLPQISHRYPVE